MRSFLVVALVGLLWLPHRQAVAAAFDVFYRPDPAVRWTFYGGRETRAAADATAADLARLGGYETKVLAAGEPVANAAAGGVPATRAIAVGGETYVAPPGRGYTPGWYRHWGGWSGVGWGGGWGGGYGGYGGSRSGHHSSFHHHHHSHEGHHAGHAGAHRAATHAASRTGTHHHSASHHAHSHHHSHSHRSHGGHHGHGGHHR